MHASRAIALMAVGWSCGGEAVVDGGRSSTAVPQCEGWDACEKQLVSRIYDLPCYPNPGPLLSFVKPDDPACAAPTEDLLVCLANNPDAAVCSVNFDYRLRCNLCPGELEAVEAACVNTLPCAPG